MLNGRDRFYSGLNLTIEVGDYVCLSATSRYLSQARDGNGIITSLRETSTHGFVEIEWDYGYTDCYPVKDLILLSRKFKDNEEAIWMLPLFDLIM